MFFYGYFCIRLDYSKSLILYYNENIVCSASVTAKHGKLKGEKKCHLECVGCEHEFNEKNNKHWLLSSETIKFLAKYVFVTMIKNDIQEEYAILSDWNTLYNHSASTTTKKKIQHNTLCCCCCWRKLIFLFRLLKLFYLPLIHSNLKPDAKRCAFCEWEMLLIVSNCENCQQCYIKWFILFNRSLPQWILK